MIMSLFVTERRKGNGEVRFALSHSSESTWSSDVQHLALKDDLSIFGWIIDQIL